jgi:hypothetical protein
MLLLYTLVMKNLTTYTHEDVTENVLWYGAIGSVKSTFENLLTLCQRTSLQKSVFI